MTGVQTCALPILTQFDTEPDSTVALRANVVSVAVAQEEAALDFFSMSPFSAHAVQKGGNGQLLPVVRVETRTTQVIGLLRWLQARDEIKAGMVAQ